MKETTVYSILWVYSVTILCRHYFELAKRTSLINKGFRSAKFPKNPYFSLFRAEVGLAKYSMLLPLFPYFLSHFHPNSQANNFIHRSSRRVSGSPRSVFLREDQRPFCQIESLLYLYLFKRTFESTFRFYSKFKYYVKT